MENIVLTNVPLDKLKQEITEDLINQLRPLLTAITPVPTATDLLSRKEAAKFLGVSLVTLNEWSKSGIVKGHRIGSRVRYKLNELEGCLKAIKTFK
ncbi:helix-turn-helix domain-containing protein [Flaviaesturariibacter aridisoli]|uniref:DNA-binding protein n=1 Tax=Flaviaesturariibacter aridisoli TaxID=2545761 RepID=A0A4R4DYS2_9BACT|nr:helix-turn-helix domain-containing protein [Flaviaesturariibacter aridisoli]TCZ66432.1 DNA-binding protein [Flaviaesturariibacter aridisoli]